MSPLLKPLPPRLSRARKVGIGALVLLLAAAPFVPRGEDEDGALRPSTAVVPAATAGEGDLTPAMRAEIEAVVAEGRRTRPNPRLGVEGLVSSTVRCAVFEGQRYCLGSGWTTDSESEVQGRMTAAARLVARTGRRAESTGDVDALTLLERTARLSPERRARQERRELTEAARSVAKVWLLRHQIQGVPLPDGFLDRHPEARATVPAGAAGASGDGAVLAADVTDPSAGSTTATASTTGAGGAATGTTAAPAVATSTATATTSPTASPTSTVAPAATTTAYPRTAVVLKRTQVAEQTRTYYCGPTSMQMIVWGWWNAAPTQETMAMRLGTTTSGTAISSMVRVTNMRTGWDNADRAGRYVVLDIDDFTFLQWWHLIQKHVAQYHAPVILHPLLHKEWFPYLDDNASGHFQVGRGYTTNDRGVRFLGYFEPWNQQRFDRSEPYIQRVQWKRAYKSYLANQAHFQHNIGV